MKGSRYSLFPIQFVPDTICSRYNMFPIQFVPDTICSRYNLCRYNLCRYKLCRYNLCRYNLYMNRDDNTKNLKPGSSRDWLSTCWQYSPHKQEDTPGWVVPTGLLPVWRMTFGSATNRTSAGMVAGLFSQILCWGGRDDQGQKVTATTLPTPGL
jgi:hypothetical protein